ncbi:MAG: Asp23/Gls24 family envelope stress response protein [Polyangiaceae bacterium]
MADLAKAPSPTTKSIATADIRPQERSKKANEDLNASVLVTDEGTTIIHNDVVAKIAGMAVREVPGVHELVPFDAGQSVTQLASRVIGRSMRSLGIHVEVGKTQAAVDVRIITEYGASIVDVSAGIRRNVRERVEAMTGLVCVEVNIEVLDLYFADEEPPPETSSQPRVM